MNMQSALNVAQYFLAKIDPKKNENDISNLKLQKLLYYAQGCSLAMLNRPLFKEKIKKWEHGPVIPEVYETFKENGSAPIPTTTSPEKVLYDDSIKELLDTVYHEYGQFSAWRLREMTHRESPWLKAHLQKDISLREMSSFFKETRGINEVVDFSDDEVLSFEEVDSQISDDLTSIRRHSLYPLHNLLKRGELLSPAIISCIFLNGF